MREFARVQLKVFIRVIGLISGRFEIGFLCQNCFLHNCKSILKLNQIRFDYKIGKFQVIGSVLNTFRFNTPQEFFNPNPKNIRRLPHSISLLDNLGNVFNGSC